MPILNEVEYQYRTRLWSDIRQYVGKGYFIHFGKTPKMGVNPSGKFHSDPHGVYFYNLDWLVKAERFANGEQFGINWPYWTIVQRHPDDHGIVLSRLSWDDLTQLATNNHWPQFEEWKRESYEKMRAPHNSAAGMFWDYIKACSPMARGGKDLPSQNAALKGVSFIEDDGLGIIHGGEPYQMVLFDPRIISVVATGNQGTNQSSDKNEHTDKEMSGHGFAFVELLKKLRGEYGGALTWSKKLPTLTFDVSGASFKLTWTPSAWDSKLVMETKWGRATKSYSFNEGQFHIKSMDEVMAFFTGIVAKTAALAKAKKDLFFTPALDETHALAGVKSLIDTESFAFTTEINNDHKQMTVTAEKTVPLGKKGEMHVVVWCLSGEYVRWAVNIRIGHYTIASARTPEDLGKVAASLKENFDQSLTGVHPNNEGYRGKFYYEEEYRAFIGMVAELSGIKSLISDYADEVAVWRGYDNKEEIFRETLRIY
jgi:hypothetical protein